MSLDDIVKVATGNGISFLAGLTWGYTTAHRDANITEPKQRQIRALLDYGLMTMWGIIPQKWHNHENPWILLSAYVGGVAGAMAGKIAGNKWWHKHSQLNEEEQKKIDGFKEKLKTAGVKSTQDFAEIMQKEYLPYIEGLKKRAGFRAKLNDEISTEVLHYIQTYHSLDLANTSEITGGFALTTEKTSQDAGVLYILDTEKIYKIEIAIEKSLIMSSENSPVTSVQICPKLVKEESYNWDKDIAKLTDEILKEKRIVCVTGGPDNIDTKKAVSMMNYMHAAAEYLAKKQKTHTI